MNEPLPPAVTARDRAEGPVDAEPHSAPRWWSEAAGSVADLGVFVPIAVALIVANGLSPTAVLLPAGLLYLVVARVYRLPVAVQPLKAFGAIAIAAGLGVDVIAAGAILMGVIFLVLGVGNWLDKVGALFPVPVIRGVQLAVAILFVKIAWGLVVDPQPVFTNQLNQPFLAVAALALFVALVIFRHRIVLVVVLVAFAVALVAASAVTLGPSAIAFPTLTLDAFVTAAVMLVLPQLPLTFANSCLAPADAARTYFGDAASAVTPSRLARTLGLANLVAGGVSGMPICHGAGGLSAHYAFGARTWRAPLLIGSALTVGALAFGDLLSDVLPSFPIPVLAALLGVAALTHALLLRDLVGWRAWTVVAAVAGIGTVWNLAIGVVIGIALSCVMRERKRSGRGDHVRTEQPDGAVSST